MSTEIYVKSISRHFTAQLLVQKQIRIDKFVEFDKVYQMMQWSCQYLNPSSLGTLHPTLHFLNADFARFRLFSHWPQSQPINCFDTKIVYYSPLTLLLSSGTIPMFLRCVVIELWREGDTVWACGEAIVHGRGAAVPLYPSPLYIWHTTKCLEPLLRVDCRPLQSGVCPSMKCGIDNE